MDVRPEFGLRAWEGRSCDGFMNRAGVGVAAGWSEALGLDDDWSGAGCKLVTVARVGMWREWNLGAPVSDGPRPNGVEACSVWEANARPTSRATSTLGPPPS